MISLTVSTDDLVVGEQTPVVLRVHNDGAGACRRLELDFAAALGLSVRRGARSLRIRHMASGETYEHDVVLLARRPGEHRIEITNLSFGDEDGTPHRGHGLALVVTAHEPVAVPTARAGPEWRAPGSIFLSYRRSDTEATVWRLAPQLVARLGAPVFHDHTSLRVGDHFLARLDRELAACEALLAVIGPTWLTTATRTGRRRLDEPADVVRREIATALQGGKTVVPVLVGEAAVPDPGELPPDLAALPARQAVRVAPDLSTGLDRLVDGLRRVLHTGPPD